MVFGFAFWGLVGSGLRLALQAKNFAVTLLDLIITLFALALAFLLGLYFRVSCHL